MKIYFTWFYDAWFVMIFPNWNTQENIEKVTDQISRVSLMELQTTGEQKLAEVSCSFDYQKCLNGMRSIVNDNLWRESSLSSNISLLKRSRSFMRDNISTVESEAKAWI